jgi:hypothetical protein
MGKGTVKTNVGEGEYVVTLNYARERVDAQLSAMAQQIAHYDELLGSLPIGQERRFVAIQKMALEKRVDFLNTYFPEDEDKTAWCADYSDELEVGAVVPTIEVPGEIGHVLVAPQHTPEEWEGPTHGQMNPVLNTTAAGCFLNWALLPGWQKWYPTYRFGEITAIDYEADTCNITLSSAISSAQGLDVNQTETLSDVEIEYMSCNSSAFEVGDEVVVKFRSQFWSAPLVIGFRSEPKQCAFWIKASIPGSAYEKPSGWSAMLTQPIETEITTAHKGTYTEDYRVLWTGTLDSEGAAEIEYGDLQHEIDEAEELHFWIRNDSVFRYFTEDWRGSAPEYSVGSAYNWWILEGTSIDWTTHPHKYDAVFGIRCETNVSAVEKTQFLNGAAETVSGVELEFEKPNRVKITRTKVCNTDLPADCESVYGCMQFNGTTVRRVPVIQQEDVVSPTAGGSGGLGTSCFLTTGMFPCWDDYGNLVGSFRAYLTCSISLEGNSLTETFAPAVTASRDGTSPGYDGGSDSKWQETSESSCGYVFFGDDHPCAGGPALETSSFQPYWYKSDTITYSMEEI